MCGVNLTITSTMSTSTHITALEKHRLPVIFNGSTIVQTSQTQSEEHWVPRGIIAKGGFGEIWLQRSVPAPGAETKWRVVKKLAQVVKGVDFSRELLIMASLMDVIAAPPPLPPCNRRLMGDRPAF